MELLQKFTLYDLLGYMLPGGVVVYAAFCAGQNTEIVSLKTAAFLVFSYLAGILLSELMIDIRALVMQAACRLTGKAGNHKKSVYEELGLPKSLLEEVLRSTKLLEGDGELEEERIPAQYLQHMYSDIQTDTKYGRIHNYASAAVMYKNLTAAFVLCSGCHLFRAERGYAALYLAGAVLFAVRERRFRKKQYGYAVHWYVEKYRK